MWTVITTGVVDFGDPWSGRLVTGGGRTKANGPVIRAVVHSVPYSFGSAVALLGALVTGRVIHGVLRGGLHVGSPAAVVGVVVGGSLLLVGHRWEQRFDPSRFVIGRTDDADEEDYEPAFSPIDGSPADDRSDFGNDRFE